MTSELKFELNEERLTIYEVWERYGHRLPIIIQVTQGHFGEINMLTYSAGHTMRLHCVAKQQRVIAKDVNGKYFSFPIDYAIKFRVARNSKKAGKEQTLREIVGETTLPVRIELCLPPDGYSLHIGQSIKQIESFGVLHLQQTYDETYFLANSITDESLDEEILSVPVYLHDLGVTIVEGIEGKHPTFFQEFQRKLDDQSATFDYNVAIGNPDIAVYEKSLSPNTQPTHYIRYSSTIRRASNTTNVHDLRKRFHNKSIDDANKRISGDYATKIINEELEKSHVVDEALPVPASKRSEWPSPRRVIATKLRTKKPDPVNKINKAMVSPLEEKVTHPQVFPPIPAICEHPIMPWTPSNEPVVNKKLPNEYVKGFSIKEILACLPPLKLEKYSKTFENDQISGDILLEFDVENLKSDYGMKSVEAIKLMKFARTGYMPK